MVIYVLRLKLELSFEQKWEILNADYLNKKTSFFLDRKIPHLQLKTQVHLKWPREVNFLGKTYAPQVVHAIDISELAKDLNLHYGSPDEGPQLVEFHIRSNLRNAGSLLNQLWKAESRCIFLKTLQVARLNFGDRALLFSIEAWELQKLFQVGSDAN